MKNQKILYIVLALIILIGIVLTAIAGLNVSLKYAKHKVVNVYIGKQFENKDIEKIAQEVTGKSEIIVQKIEVYGEMASIKVDEISDEQVEELNKRINEKYEIENAVDSLEINEVAKMRTSDLVKPYIVPCTISMIIIIVYAAIRFRKLNIFEILGKIVGMNILAELLYLAILAIARIPVNAVSMPLAMAIYAITSVVVFMNLEEKEAKVVKESK